MKGTKDYYPEDKRIQNHIFSVWKKIAEKYGYEEVEPPILESADIYKKSGQEIPKQMYTFKDKSNRLLTLRPETTPSIARMVSQKSLPKPIKWYSISTCFRYEAPQSGRSRQFTQFNLDCLGTKSIKADAEVILTAIEIMKSFNLTKKDFYIRISNRKLFQDLLNNLNLKNTQQIARLIDKIDKISKKDLELSLKDLKLSQLQIKSLFKILETKDLERIKIKSQGLVELKELFTYLRNYNVLDYCKLDLSIMRGFDYYTSTVFEVFDTSKEFRAIAGGGRYDELAKDCPGVGYGMGDIVLTLFLEKKKKLPELKKEMDYYVAPINEAVIKQAVQIAQKLRQNNNVEIDLMNKNLSKQLEYANSISAKNVIIVGEKDLKNKKITIRDMKTGKEKKVNLTSII